MKEILIAYMSGVVLFTGLFLIGYMIAAGVQFTRAVRIVIKQDRFHEWFSQPYRLQIGSGFRLFRHFSKPPTP